MAGVGAQEWTLLAVVHVLSESCLYPVIFTAPAADQGTERANGKKYSNFLLWLVFRFWQSPGFSLSFPGIERIKISTGEILGLPSKLIIIIINSTSLNEARVCETEETLLSCFLSFGLSKCCCTSALCKVFYS